MRKNKAGPLTLEMPQEQARRRAERRDSAGARVFELERGLARRLLASLRDPALRVVLWNGEEIAASSSTPSARVIFRDRLALLKTIIDPGLQFGDLYSAGRIEIEGDLLAVLEAAYRAGSSGIYQHHRQRVRHRRRNSLVGSRRNIHHHYDIGNDFYRLWLDERMVYTCAYFPTPDMTLEAAQVAKMDHVCRKLRLQPGDTVVEAGCGWGALAMHMARHYDVRVKAFNISHEQIAHARERAAAEGLASRVEFIEDDYRNISGRFDVFASVGMLEHVGLDHYRDLGEVINRCLPDRGRGLIHSIGRNHPTSLNSWIAKRIFPGSYVPSLREMLGVLEPYPFSVVAVSLKKKHYARTLEHLRARFEGASDQVERMFDRRFVRMWRLYLAGSVAAFTTGWMQLFQITFTRPMDNAIPWSRAWLYKDK